MDRVGDKRERSPEALDEHSKRLRSAAAATEELMKFIENPRGQVFSAEYIMELIEGERGKPRCTGSHGRYNAFDGVEYFGGR